MIGALRKHSFGVPDEPVIPKSKIVYSETREQKRVVAWLRKRADWMVMRLENAQQRTQAQIARDKALGLLTGAPDLVLMFREYVVWLEMKSGENGRLSSEQKQIHAQLSARKQTVIVGWGADDAIQRLEEFENEHLF